MLQHELHIISGPSPIKESVMEEQKREIEELRTRTTYLLDRL